MDDDRESPSYVLMKKLEQKGARMDYNDPYVPEIKVTREHHEYAGRKSVEITDDYDCVLLATHHNEYKDFDFSEFKAPLACHAVVLKSVGGSIREAVSLKDRNDIIRRRSGGRRQEAGGRRLRPET